MAVNVLLKCSCGAFRGLIEDVSPANGNRGICMCDDCQAYAHYLGRAADVLDENGGTDVFPVAPAKLKITQGIENLKSLRLTPKGMIRWYAGCCKTPIANSMPIAKMPFAGVVHTIIDVGNSKSLDEVIGPVRARFQGRYGIGKLPKDAYQRAPLTFLLRTVRFLFEGLLKGQYKPSPFFDSQTGQPTVEPYILTSEEREYLRQFCGPKAVSKR